MNKEQQEFLDVIDSIYKVSEKDHKEILKFYRNSRENINQFLADLYAKYGVDGVIDYAKLQKYNRIGKLEQLIKDEGTELVKEERKLFPIILAAGFASIYYKTAYTLEKNIGVSINFKLLKKEFINEAVNFNWSGVPFSQRIWDNQDKLVKTLRTEIVRGIRDGESIDKVARRVRKQFNSKAYESQRLMETEMARVIESAQDTIYKDSDVLETVQYLATLESNTCDDCAALDGNTYKVNERKPIIPRHPKCRCTYAPYFEDYQPTRRKDNETKEIIEYKNFEEWAKAKGIN